MKQALLTKVEEVKTRFQHFYFVYTKTNAFKIVYKNYMAIVTDKKGESLKSIDNIDNLEKFHNIVVNISKQLNGFVFKNDSAGFFKAINV